MKAHNKAAIAHRRKLALSLGLFLLAVYLLVYRGGFHSVDEVSMFAVTESLVKFGRLDTNQIAWTQWTTTQAEAQGFFGRDGNVYSKKGLALSLAQAPLYALALYLPWPTLGMLQTVSLLNAGLTALTGLLLFMFVWRLGYGPGVSVVTALIFGLGTIAFVYAKYLFSEPLAAFLLLLAAYMLFAYRQEGGLRHVVIAGLATGFAVVARANNLFLLPIFGLYLVWITTQPVSHSAGQQTESYSRQKNYVSRFTFYASHFTQPAALRSFAVFILALALPGFILLGYNALRSGNPLQTGYDLTLFTPNVLLGLYKLLVSPLRGLFVYSPILLLSLPGWWWLRRRFPAEAWLFAGLVGVTVALFSAWSSGEGLSWGSRFLVPVIPFLALCLAPVIEQLRIASDKLRITNYELRIKNQVLQFAFYTLLLLSGLIQLLGVAINPWVSLARLQAEFGGEFFLENTAALYDFSTSQLVGQWRALAVENSDVAWWQPWGFDGLAFGLSAGLVLLTGWFLWHNLAESQGRRVANSLPFTIHHSPFTINLAPAPLLIVLAAAVTLFLLARYYHTDRQFGPLDDGYTAALTQIAAEDDFNSPIVTVAQYHYHVPMNRFKGRHPLIGLAQQKWPPPDTALPLLTAATRTPNGWLVTVGVPPAAPDNAAEQWLARNSYKISDEWLPNEVRLLRFTTLQPDVSRPIDVTLAGALHLAEVRLRKSPEPGQPLPVEFVWQTQTAPEADYTLFLQLLDINGAVIAQTNNPPAGGYQPTSRWQPGQSITSRHGLLIPTDAPPGDYRLITGLFNPTSGQRLTTDSGADFIDLGLVTFVNCELGMVNCE